MAIPTRNTAAGYGILIFLVTSVINPPMVSEKNMKNIATETSDNSPSDILN